MNSPGEGGSSSPPLTFLDTDFNSVTAARQVTESAP